MVQRPAKKLRTIQCCFFTLEDVYVILCLLVAVASLIATLFEAFNLSGWRRIYVSSFLALGALVCFLQAVPSWRVLSFSPHILGAVSILSLGNALGFGLSLIWEKGLHIVFDKALLAGSSLFSGGPGVDIDPPTVPNYSDAIAFLGVLGVATAILSAIHEFALKREKYPCSRPCRYLFFLITVGVTVVWLMALGVITINPDLAPKSHILGREMTLVSSQLEPTIVMASLRFGGAAAAILLLFRRNSVAAMAKLLVLIAALGHTAMAVFCFVDFGIGSQWALFPNSLIGILFASTAALLILTAFTEQCCAPKPPKSDGSWLPTSDVSIVSSNDAHTPQPRRGLSARISSSGSLPPNEMFIGADQA